VSTPDPGRTCPACHRTTPADTCPHPWHGADPKRPYFPDIAVPLTRGSTEVRAIVGAVTRALRWAGQEESVQDAFRREATSGDYDNVITTAMRWVDVS
jgi:hypothetical protein